MPVLGGSDVHNLAPVSREVVSNYITRKFTLNLIIEQRQVLLVLTCSHFNKHIFYLKKRIKSLRKTLTWPLWVIKVH